jgi:hypothetical protein
MADLTNYLESALLAHVTGGAAFTQPTVWYVKLHIGDPGEDGTANPAAETTRAQVSSWTGTNPRTNAAAVNWTSVSAAETVTHVSVWDASSGGNPLAKGDIAASRTLAIGDNLSIPIGDISLALD